MLEFDTFSLRSAYVSSDTATFCRLCLGHICLEKSYSLNIEAKLIFFFELQVFTLIISFLIFIIV